MDKNYYRDDFEELLREKADEFKMQPTRRVWKSVYNNMHPSRRWPSNTITLVLVTALLFIGYFNSTDTDKATSNNLSKVSATDKQPTAIADLKAPSHSTNTTGNNNGIDNLNDAHSSNQVPVVSNPNLQPAKNSMVNNTQEVIANKTKQSIKPSLQNNNNNKLAIAKSNTPKEATLTENSFNNNLKTAENKTFVKDSKIASPTTLSSLQNNNTESKAIISTVESTETIISNDNTSLEITANSSANTSIAAENKLDIPSVLTVQKKQSTVSSNLSNSNSNITADQDKAWIENFAFYNKSKSKKWKEKMAYELYVTPGISYRTLTNNVKYNNNPAAGFILNTESAAINQKPDLSAEMGAAMLYSFAKKLRLKFGLQFNYSSYAINAYETNHPVLTTLTLNDLNSGYPYLVSRNTIISNVTGIGAATFHNKSFQFSVPIGFEYKLAGNNKLQWYGAATIQPTFIVAAKSYLLSSDRKNYVADNSMIRNWSLNTGFETFISYQTQAGVSLQVGPQFRYQLPSTYGKKYSLDEKLFSAGMKIGIVRNF